MRKKSNFDSPSHFHFHLRNKCLVNSVYDSLCCSSRATPMLHFPTYSTLHSETLARSPARNNETFVRPVHNKLGPKHAMQEFATSLSRSSPPSLIYNTWYTTKDRKARE